MKPRFWKLSHGAKLFSESEIITTIQNKLVYIDKDTKGLARSEESQAEDFVNAPIGDYFYLTHGNNRMYFIGQFSGPANIFSIYGDGWIDRPFRFIRPSTSAESYSRTQKWWTPNHRSTFAPVKDNEISMFEELILDPYFSIKLKDFGVEV